jgi:hypothetical protein
MGWMTYRWVPSPKYPNVKLPTSHRETQGNRLKSRVSRDLNTQKKKHSPLGVQRRDLPLWIQGGTQTHVFFKLNTTYLVRQVMSSTITI